MDKIFIEGPCKLSGSVEVSRAKNAYLPIQAATILNPHGVKLRNLPELRDIRTMNRILQELGVGVESTGNLTSYDPSNVVSCEATYDLVKTMRASVLVLGPLLGRFKTAKVSLPGGCAIGTRPIDIHLENLEKMGTKINLTGGYVEASTDGLVGADIRLRFPSVGATENIMMAAVLAKGVTTIDNAALEPEIVDLANFLMAQGVRVEGAGTSKITIEGLEDASKLKPVEYEAIGDRVEAATYLIGALITNSEITVTKIEPDFLSSVLDTLKEMGANLQVEGDKIHVKKSKLVGMNVDTAPYPGFPTDVQAQLMTLATQAIGTSVIAENIFENRFMHVPELARLGANIVLKGKTAVVTGKTELKAAPVMCTDLRASAALVIAALAAKGTTEIQRVYHLDRGYEKLDQKLGELGVNVKRINNYQG